MIAERPVPHTVIPGTFIDYHCGRRPMCWTLLRRRVIGQVVGEVVNRSELLDQE
jgi:hypothetical protein